MKENVKKENDHITRRLILEAKPIAHYLALGALLDICAVLCAVASPEILGGLVEQLYEFGIHGGQSIRNTLIPGLGLLLLTYAGHSIFSYLNMYLMNNVVTHHFTCNIRIKISDKIRRLPVRYVDQTPVGDILSRMIGDVSEVGGYVHQIFDVMVKGFAERGVEVK